MIDQQETDHWFDTPWDVQLGLDAFEAELLVGVLAEYLDEHPNLDAHSDVDIACIYERLIHTLDGRAKGDTP